MDNNFPDIRISRPGRNHGLELSLSITSYDLAEYVPAVMAYDLTTGEPYTDLSVNLIAYGIAPAPDCILVPMDKGPDLRRDIVTELTALERLIPTGRSFIYGHDCRAFEYRIIPKNRTRE